MAEEKQGVKAKLKRDVKAKKEAQKDAKMAVKVKKAGTAYSGFKRGTGPASEEQVGPYASRPRKRAKGEPVRSVESSERRRRTGEIDARKSSQ